SMLRGTSFPSAFFDQPAPGQLHQPYSLTLPPRSLRSLAVAPASPLRNLLRSHLRRRIVAELIHQASAVDVLFLFDGIALQSV
ncbi:MAG: hypothetical protein ACREIC_26275, partial [Limisphaerales bacterium]